MPTLLDEDDNQYRQQLIKFNGALKKKQPEYIQRHDKVIFNMLILSTLEKVKCDVIPYPPYLPDFVFLDYHKIESTQHRLSEQHLQSYKKIKIRLDEWSVLKE